MQKKISLTFSLEILKPYYLYSNINFSDSKLTRALLYTYTNKIVYDKILLSKSVVYSVSAFPGPYASPYAYVRTASRPIRSKNWFSISRISTLSF